MARRLDKSSPLHWMPGLPGARGRGKVQIQILGNLGDANPLDYGGYIVYRVYDPKNDTHWITGEYWDEPIDDTYQIYQWNIEKDVIRELDWVDDWEKIATSVGMPVEVLMTMARSEDILKRAQVYEEVGRFYGLENLDSYPNRLNRKEMEKRWPEFA